MIYLIHLFQITYAAGAIKGSDFERKAKFKELEAYMFCGGQPWLFVTLNFADLKVQYCLYHD